MKKMTKRRQQAIDSKNLIYETAIKLMASEGFERLTIEKISKEAGVSVGAFYHYFSSKNDLLSELFLRGDEYFSEKVANDIQGLNTEAQILSYFDHFARFYIGNGVEIIKSLYKTQDKLFTKEDRVIVTLLRDIVARGFAKNELNQTMSVDETVDFLFTAARGLVFKWCVEDGQFPLEDRMHRYFLWLLRAFRPDCPHR